MYLNGIKNDQLILPIPNNSTFGYAENKEHVWHLFVIRTKYRTLLQNYLEQNGIQTLIHYPIPPNKQLAYKALNQLDYTLTNTIHDEVLSLPLSPVMLETEVKKVIDVLNLFKAF